MELRKIATRNSINDENKILQIRILKLYPKEPKAYLIKKVIKLVE